MTRRSAIRFAWTDFHHRIILTLLWLFYRGCNLAGAHRASMSDSDLGWGLHSIVEQFASDGTRVSVYNFGIADGRVYTVMIAQVCGTGEPPQDKPHV